jgi:hypothetical protein
MGLTFLIVAFAGSLAATFPSLGWGFVAVFAVGYFNGVIRARYLGVYTTFMFDASVLGLYLGFLVKHWRRGPAVGSGALFFVGFLIAWPSLLTMIPVNHYLVQLVALRATIWFLPLVLIAARLTVADLAVMARGLVVLNLVALAAGLYLYLYGVEALYPRNAITGTIYGSMDVAGGHRRIPSTFLNSHGYGGTMLLSLPLLLDRVAAAGVRPRDRGLAWAGVVAAGSGMLLCGARTPLVLFAMMLAIAWVLTRFSLGVGMTGAVITGGLLVLAGTSERLQRASSVIDADYVARRVEGSANTSFFALLRDYPIGAGMGSASGNSIPYFLSEVAPQQIPLENEYARILVDQGWVGLAAWLAFVAWLFSRPPPVWGAPWWLGVAFMYALCLATWLTAFMGTGLLAGVPTAVLLLTEMGVLVGVRGRGAVCSEANPRPAPVETRRGIPRGMIRGPGGCWLPATGKSHGKTEAGQSDTEGHG